MSNYRERTRHRRPGDPHVMTGRVVNEDIDREDARRLQLVSTPEAKSTSEVRPRCKTCRQWPIMRHGLCVADGGNGHRYEPSGAKVLKRPAA